MKMDPRAIDLTGKRFGRLVATGYAPGTKEAPGSWWHCVCDCGSLTAVRGASLRAGHTQSCGCLRLERQKAAMRARKKHGMAGKKRHPVYSVWLSMIARCHNPNCADYTGYGARGITVCTRWRESFEAFFQDMGPRPDGMSIDRKDGSKGYEPANCAWATAKQQARNASTNRVIEMRGEKKPLSEWAEIAGINYATVRGRLARGWEPDRAIFTPAQPSARYRSHQ